VVTVVGGFVLGGWDVAEGSVEAGGVEPVDPDEGLELDLVELLPGSAAFDDLGLEQPDDGLGQRVVVRVTDRAD
jgi:hypothetical protein